MIKWEISLKYPEIFVFISYRNNFLGNKNEFETAKVNEPSVLESMKFYCILNKLCRGFLLDAPSRGVSNEYLLSNFNGSNIVGTMEICSRHR